MADVHSAGMRRGQNSTPKLLTQWPPLYQNDILLSK